MFESLFGYGQVAGISWLLEHCVAKALRGHLTARALRGHLTARALRGHQLNQVGIELIHEQQLGATLGTTLGATSEGTTPRRVCCCHLKQRYRDRAPHQEITS